MKKIIYAALITLCLSTTCLASEELLWDYYYAKDSGVVEWIMYRLGDHSHGGTAVEVAHIPLDETVIPSADETYTWVIPIEHRVGIAVFICEAVFSDGTTSGLSFPAAWDYRKKGRGLGLRAVK